uniref:Uncharacterized protein n=1 Tax=Oryza punctata TaxID=4537 RepID=A0A0E0MJW4_ORYPU
MVDEAVRRVVSSRDRCSRSREADVEVAKSRGAHDDAVTQSRQSFRNMTLNSRYYRTVEDETSHRFCQTWGQLGTNVRKSVGNTTRAS